MRNADDQTTVTLSVGDESERDVRRTFKIETITPAVDDEEFWALVDDTGMPRLILTLEEFEEIHGTFDSDGEEST